MASEPDTTTERSHTTATSATPASIWQQLRRCLQRNAEVAHPYIPLAAAGLAAGLPLLSLVWSWAEAQAWDSLGLRLAIGGLCVPLVVCRHWPAAWARAVPAYWAAVLMLAVPWHSTLLLVANGYGSLWQLNMLAGVTMLTVLQPLATALGTFAVGSALGLLSVPILLHLQPALARPVPLDIVTHVLVLAIATALSLRLLQLARLRVRQPADHTRPTPTPTPTANPANLGLLSEVVNNSVLERLSALEAEHGPAKARQMLNAQERRFVAMMHADIRGFARLVTAANEAEVAKLVSQVFAEVTSVGQDLSVIKPIGDGLFAFSDVQPADDAAVNVLCLASVFVSGVVNVNTTMAAPRGLPELVVGAALHAGEAVYGNVSGPHLADLTVLGVAPNLTARLEELTKHPTLQRVLGPNAMLLSEEFVQLLLKADLHLPVRLLDLEELEVPVRDFPAVTRVWGLTQQQALEFAGEARLRIAAARQARRPSKSRPAEPASDGLGLDGITLEGLLNASSVAVVYVDANWVARYCNATMAANLGLTPEQVVGRTPFEYTPTDFRRSIFYDACVECASQARAVSQIGYSTVLSRWLSVNLFPLRGGALLVAFEATGSALKAHHLEATSAPDPLTGLRNKLALEQHVLALLSKNTACDVLLLSLRRFRDINETYGYTTGDLVLMQVGSRLKSQTLSNEALFRVGGDEFAVVLAQPAQPAQSERVDPMERGHQLLHLLQSPVVVEGQRIPLVAAVGVSRSPDDGSNYQALLRRAGLALRQAKRQAVSQVAVAAYSAGLEAAERKRVLLEQDLRECLDGAQWEIVLQPRMSLASGAVLAAEALIRWRHPTRGLLAPSEFLPVAREIGVMRAIDTWVMRQVIAVCVQICELGQDLAISCNLSDEALGDVLFAARLSKELAASGVPARRLEIELSEGDLMVDVQASLRTLQALSELGVHLSVDHFGRGYPSSFSHLVRWPVDTIKLDPSVVADLSGTSPTGRFTRSVIRMAHSLGLHVAVDGVEDAATMRHLQRLQADSVQGFALAHPMTLQDLLSYVATKNAAVAASPDPFTI